MAGAVSLAFEILAKDKASKEFSNVGDAAEKAGKKGAAFGKVMGGVLVAGIGAATAVLKTGFDEVKDYQTGMADLTNVLKTTHNVAGVTTGGLENLASSIEGYSGQTDDSIVKSEGLLLTFTNIHNAAGKNNDIFTQATKLTADMAQKFGGDASDSAVKLGKALNDPTKGLTALSKIGVSFTEQQQKQIKSMQKAGDVQGAQKIILAELTKEVGGSAKAYGTTLAGQTDIAKRKFEGFSQGLVTKMIPVLASMGTWVQKNSGWLKPLVIVVGSAALAFAVVSKAIALTNIVLTAMGSAETVALGPIGLIVIAIAALAAGLVYAYRHCETFRNIVNTAFRAVSATLSAVWDNGIKPIFRLWVTVWLGVVGALVHGAASAFGWVPGIGGKLKAAAREFDAFANKVKASLSNIHPAPIVLQVQLAGPLGKAAQTALTTKLDRLGGYATGTTSAMRGLKWVGENGPELMSMQGGERVYTNAQSMAMAGGGGGGQVVQNNLYLDGKLIHTSLLDLRRGRGQGLGLG